MYINYIFEIIVTITAKQVFGIYGVCNVNLLEHGYGMWLYVICDMILVENISSLLENKKYQCLTDNAYFNSIF